MTMRTLFCVVLCCIRCLNCKIPIEEEHYDSNWEEKAKQVDALFNDYNRFVVTSNNEPQLVRLEFSIFGFSDVSKLNMDFTFSYFMRIAWRDDRLRFRPEHYENVSYLILHPEQMNKIWRPDIFYRNEKGESISKPFTISDSTARIYPSGDVHFVRKLETTFRCQMKLQHYPFDIQKCHMDISTFSLTNDRLKFGFLDSPPVDFYRETELTSFELLDVETQERNITVRSGTYNSLMIIFKFRRFINFYILQVTVFSVSNAHRDQVFQYDLPAVCQRCVCLVLFDDQI